MLKPISFALAALLVATPVMAAPFRDKIDPYPYQVDPLEQAKPLMVIRYNQNNVYYQLPLYNAVQKSLQVKPTAQFTFLSKVPFTGHPEKDRDAEDAARRNWQSVLQTLNEIGLPDKQMNVRFEKSNQVLNNEILMFVQ